MRKAISKKIRFEVFKRDSFKCQYCGRYAPDVILEVDHINPVSKGGDNDILNLVTSCRDCNAGKSDRLLSDNSTIEKQRAQLEELNERREQLEQMLQWREGLKDIDDMAFSAAVDAWDSIVPGFHINPHGEKQLKKLIVKHGLNTVLDAIEESARYLKADSEGNLIYQSVDTAFKKIGGICYMQSQPNYKNDLYYIRGILRNRLHYVNDRKCMLLLEEAYKRGTTIEDMKEIAKSVKNWTEFSETLTDAMEACNG